MRPSNKSRSRNKSGNNGNHQNNNNNNSQRQRMGNIINRVFESAGPDGKVRGTPQQIIDKYQALARDAQVSGDRVAAESYLQHSEHYSRLLGEAQRQQMENRGFNPSQDNRGGDDQQPRNDDGFDRRPQPVSPAMPVASGLAMIDADDADYPSGPIETPEGRRTPVESPAPVVELARAEPQPEPQPDFAPEMAPVGPPATETPEEAGPGEVLAEAPVEAPRRTRARRRPKAEVAAEAEAAPQAE